MPRNYVSIATTSRQRLTPQCSEQVLLCNLAPRRHVSNLKRRLSKFRKCGSDRMQNSSHLQVRRYCNIRETGDGKPYANVRRLKRPLRKEVTQDKSGELAIRSAATVTAVYLSQNENIRIMKVISQSLDIIVQQVRTRTGSRNESSSDKLKNLTWYRCDGDISQKICQVYSKKYDEKST